MWLPRLEPYITIFILIELSWLTNSNFYSRLKIWLHDGHVPVLQGGERQEELHLHPDPDEEEVTQVTAILNLQERL